MRRMLCVATVIALSAAAVQADEYRSQWNDEVNASIDRRIEKYRKADWSGDGFPVGAEVAVEQISHDFQFGAQMFYFGQLGSDERNAIYKSTFTNLFNAATIPLYWDKMEPQEGRIRYSAGPRDTEAFWNAVADISVADKQMVFAEFRRPAPDMLLEFCEANGISTHGHVMIYPPYGPAWVTNGVDKAGLAARYERRIRQLGGHYGARMSQWDVVNESVNRSCKVGGPVDDKICWGRPWLSVPDDYTFRCFKWAERSFPDGVKMAINDSWRGIYVPFVKSLLERGAKIDVVGIQMHIFGADDVRKIAAGEPCLANGTSWAPADQIEMLSRLDTLNRPIHVSEITIPGIDDSEAGQETQARLVRDNYRLWFSWPTVYRITWWNLVDYMFSKEYLASGLYTHDMRRKKAWFALDDLINREWKTRLSAKADGNGRVAFRGFRGCYRLSWKSPDGETLSKTIYLK